MWLVKLLPIESIAFSFHFHKYILPSQRKSNVFPTHFLRLFVSIKTFDASFVGFSQAIPIAYSPFYQDHFKGHNYWGICQNKMCALMLQNFLLQHWPWHLQPLIQEVQCVLRTCLCKYSTYKDIHQVQRDPRACNQIVSAFLVSAFLLLLSTKWIFDFINRKRFLSTL